MPRPAPNRYGRHMNQTSARGLLSLAITASLALAACGAAPGGADAPGDGDAAAGGGAPSGDFCENVAHLEIATREDRPHIQAVLEGQTPPGYEEQVATIGQFMEIVNEGGEPHQDADFLEAYDNAWNDLRDWCGLRGQGG